MKVLPSSKNGKTPAIKLKALHDLDGQGIAHAIFVWNENNSLTTGTGADKPLGADFNRLTDGLEDVSKVSFLLEKMEKRGSSCIELETISFQNAYQYIKNIRVKGEGNIGRNTY